MLGCRRSLGLERLRVQGYQDWQTIQELNADRNCKASDGISFLEFAVLNQQMTRMNEDSRSWDDAMRALEADNGIMPA